MPAVEFRFFKYEPGIPLRDFFLFVLIGCSTILRIAVNANITLGGAIVNNFIRIASLAATVVAMNGTGVAAALACEEGAGLELIEQDNTQSSSALLRGGVHPTGTSGPREPWTRVPAMTPAPEMAPTYVGTRVMRGG